MQCFIPVSNKSTELDQYQQFLLLFSMSNFKPMKCLDTRFLKLTALTSALMKGGKCK